MSSTGRKTERLANDDYPTPRWCVHRLLEGVELPGGLWLEPCAGAGSIVRAVSEVRSDVQWLANELNPIYLTTLAATPSVISVSGLDARDLRPSGPLVNLTNPPFGPSLEILMALLRDEWSLTIFLQRLNWAAGPRRDLFRAAKPSVYVLPDRPSFIDMYDEKKPDVLKAQTDSIEYAWFVFDGLARFELLGDTPDVVRRAEIEEGRANGTRPKKASKQKHLEEAA